MKIAHLLIALTFAAVSCKENRAEDESAEGASGYWEKLTMQPFTDAQGMVMVELPFPSTWKIVRNHGPNEPSIIGPHGTKVFDFPGKSFLFTNDPSMRQTYQRVGQPLRAMPGIDALVREDLVPWSANLGLRYLRHYEIPELSKIDQWYNDQLFKAVPGKTKVTVIGSDWENQNGEPHFLLTHLVVGSSAGLQTWFYSCNGMQAEKAHFETVKKQLIFALANGRYNPEQIMAYNQREAQKAGQSWAAHNQRMAANQAAFEASQRAHVNRSNAINDAIMSGWRERNAVSDKAQERFIDTINEKTNVVDPTTGQSFKVDSGSNNYWMNRDGKYISTDHSTYDPNLDELMNRQHWQKLENAE